MVHILNGAIFFCFTYNYKSYLFLIYVRNVNLIWIAFTLLLIINFFNELT